MANREGSSSPASHCVLVETSLDTRLATLVHNGESISDFKDQFGKEHKECFPQVGEIKITALKVKRRSFFYHFSDSMILSTFFNGTTKNWFMYADVVRVEKCEPLTIMAADQNCSNPKLLEKKKKTAIDTVPVFGHTKDLTSEEALETEVTKKPSRKRKIKSSDAKESRKKPANDLNQSAIATTTSKCAVDDILIGSIGKDVEGGEKNGISMGENQQSSDAGRVSQEKTTTINSEIVDGHTMDEVEDVQANQTPKEALETELAMRKSNSSDESHKACVKVPREKLDHLTGAIEQDLEKGEKTAELVKIDQDKDLAPTLELADGHITSKDDVNESHVGGEVQAGLDAEHCVILPREKLGAIEKDNERGEGSRLAPSALDNIQTDNFVSYPESQLEANSGLTREKKRRRKKSLKDHINQSSAAVTSTSRDIVKDINGVPGNVDCVDATSGSCLISRRETHDNPLAEAMQKENEMGEKIDKDVESGKAIPSASDNIQTDNFVSHPENQLVSSSGLTTGPASEKKRRRKKSSKDQIHQSTGDATTTSKEVVNERDTVSGSIARVDAISESFPNPTGEKLTDTLVQVVQNENEMGDKLVDNVGSKEATFTGADNLQAADLASTPHDLVQESKTLDHTGKFMKETRTREHEVAKDNVEMDADEAKSGKSTKKKKSRKAKTSAIEDTLVSSGAQNVEPIKVADGEGPDNVIRNVLDSLQQKNETKENLDKSGKKSSKRLKKRSLNVLEAQVLSVEVNNAAQEEAPAINNPKDTDASFSAARKDTESDASHLKKRIEVTNITEDNNPAKQFQKDKVDDVGDEVSGGAKSKKEKKSSKKPKERNGRVEGNSQLQSRVKKNDGGSGSKVSKRKEVVKKSSNPFIVEKSKLNFFKDAEMWNSTEDDESKTSDVYSKTPLDNSSSDDDSDVTSMSRKQGNNLGGGTSRISGSLQDILRSSRSYKKAKLTASQSEPDIFDDEIPALDCVPDSQAI